MCAHAVPLPGADPLHVQAVLLRYYPELLTQPVDDGQTVAPPTLAELARTLPAQHRLVAVPGTGGGVQWLSVAPGTALPEHAWVCPSTAVRTLAGPDLPLATRQRFEGQLTRRAQLALSATAPRFPRALRLLLAASVLPLCLVTPPLVSALLAVVTAGLLASFWWPQPRVEVTEDVDVLNRRVTLELLSDALVPFHLVVVPASDDQTATILSRSGQVRARVRADVDESVSVLTSGGPVLLMGWAQPAPGLDHEMTLQGAVATRLMLGEVLQAG
ncbi:hypothetical protein [Deinococcus multiflagellatus]|uniref:Uncharacterized protein n=1 Tax=Deinococcus multiflagellatus TaxID=1656887 RepID=A0ABW1ZUD7_9DEIO